MNALAPQILVLPDWVLVKFSAEIDATTTLKDITIHTSIKQAMHFSKTLLRVTLDLLEHCFAHISKSVETIGLQFAWLVEASHEFRYDNADFWQFN